MLLWKETTPRHIPPRLPRLGSDNPEPQAGPENLS